MGNYYDKKSTGGRTTSKIENQDSVAAIYALEQLHSTDIFGFGTKIVDFCIKCEGEEDIEIFNKEKHIFIQLKSSVIGKSDFADILEHYLTLNSDNTSTENFFVLTSFVPIRINEKNFKEYLDDYVKVLVNPYETDEKKNQVKDALISNFALSKYADIIDKVTKAMVDQKKEEADRKYKELQKKLEEQAETKINLDKKHTTVEEKHTEVVVQRTKLESMKKNLVENIATLNALDENIKKLADAITEFTTTRASLEEKSKKAQNAFTEANAKIEPVEKEIQKAETLYKKSVDAVVKGLRDNGFDSEEQAKTLFLDEDEVNELNSVC